MVASAPHTRLGRECIPAADPHEGEFGGMLEEVETTLGGELG